MAFSRVFHPTLNSWKDVPSSEVEAWKQAGWLKTKPKHVDDSEAAKPGEGYTPPAAVVDVGTPSYEDGAPVKGSAAK